MENLQTRLKQARTAANLTQAQLAKTSGLSQSTIAQIESGRNQGTRFADQLAKALKVPIDWLLTGTSSPTAIDQDSSLDPVRSDTKQSWTFIDLVEPRMSPSSNKVLWKVVHAEAAPIRTGFLTANKIEPTACKLMRCKDRSMEPYLYYDEWFMINAEDRTLRNQENYAFLRGETDYFVSQVLLLPNGGVRLHSFNSPDSDFDFAPGAAEKELSILGRVFFRVTGATQMDLF